MTFTPQPDVPQPSPEGNLAGDTDQSQSTAAPDAPPSRPLTVPEIDFNAPQVHAAEIPAINGIGTARSLARMYAAVIGDVGGIRLLRPDTVTAAAREQASGTDQVLRTPTRYATGYMLPTPALPSLGPAAFGHGGRGGSLAFADPQHRLSFAYVMNHIIEQDPDPRADNLVAAVNDALSGTGTH